MTYVCCHSVFKQIYQFRDIHPNQYTQPLKGHCGLYQLFKPRQDHSRVVGSLKTESYLNNWYQLSALVTGIVC